MPCWNSVPAPAWCRMAAPEKRYADEDDPKTTRAALALAAARSGPAIAQLARPGEMAMMSPCKAAPEILVQLPAGVSRSLKLAPIPTTEPIPLVIGSGWTCETTSQGSKISRTFTVICNEDQSFCTCAVGTCPRN
jgi:hypothetical protein